MNKLFCYTVLIFLLISLPVKAAKNEFISLCYHDIVEGLTDKLDVDQMAVGTDNLIAQFSWLKKHNYNVISLQDIVDAKSGKKPLPEKAVLITFDDGYLSVYKYLYPLLKMYDYTAVVAVVGKWLSYKPGETVTYGDHDEKPRDFFLSWEQLREMQGSGHIEIASHSFDLHHGELGNPQGNVQPATTTRIYSKKTGQYETDQEYFNRIKNDLKANSDLIEKHTGVRPRSMVWPYGAHSKQTNKISEDLDMPITLTLKAGRNTLVDLSEIRRILVMSNPTLSDFVYEIEEENPQETIVRAVRISLDDIYDKDPKKFNQNFDRLLDRIKDMSINTVYISAFSDLDNDGYAEALYFPNKYLPVRGDILNRVSWQIETRAGNSNHINVHMVMPITSFKNQHGLLSEHDIIEIYGDVAKFSYTEGLLFVDENGYGSEGFVKKLVDQVKYYRSRVEKTALLLSDQKVIDAVGQADFWPKLQRDYDGFVINVDRLNQSSEKHLESLLQALPKEKKLKNFVFELQTVDKKTGAKIPEDILKSGIDLLQERKVIQLSHFPDDVPGNHPPLELIKSKISIRDFPFEER